MNKEKELKASEDPESDVSDAGEMAKRVYLVEKNLAYLLDLEMRKQIVNGREARAKVILERIHSLGERCRREIELDEEEKRVAILKQKAGEIPANIEET
jgi:hypothetical protein